MPPVKTSQTNREKDLVGERLVLRLARPEDADALARFYAVNDAHLSRYESPKPREFQTPTYWRLETERRRASFRHDQTFRPFLFDATGSLLGQTNEVVGSAGLSSLMRGVFSASFLGYALDGRLQGRGLMHEGLGLLVDYAFFDLNLHRIMANYDPENERSARVLGRLGFQVEGYAKDYLFLNGQWRDHVLTTLVNDRWRTPPGMLLRDADGQVREVPSGRTADTP